MYSFSFILIVTLSLCCKPQLIEASSQDLAQTGQQMAIPDQTSYTPEGDLEGYEEEIELPLMGQELTYEQMPNALKLMIAEEVERNPHLYAVEDISRILDSDVDWHSSRFLEQRSYNLGRAYQLAVKTLRWRRRYQIASLRAEYFPCDLFALGLIFEHGVTNDVILDGQRFPPLPVIWLRVGALGKVVKQLEKYTPKRMIQNKLRSIVTMVRGTKRVVNRLYGKPEHKSPEEKLSMNGAAASHPAINFILQSIAWWIEDWEARHNYNNGAMLVIDFENTGDVYSSYTVSDFITSLDDRFPGLFNQIIGFRHKTSLTSLHGPAQMFNKILNSRIKSSVETDAKLRYVNSRNALAQYIPIQSANGVDILPEHIRGDCSGFYKELPHGCNSNSMDFETRAPFDVRQLQAVKSEFYRCESKLRNLMNPRNKY